MKITLQEARVYDRICFRIPERGGYRLGFGDITKINKKTIDIVDRKHEGEQPMRVDKALVYEVLRF